MGGSHVGHYIVKAAVVFSQKITSATSTENFCFPYAIFIFLFEMAQFISFSFKFISLALVFYILSLRRSLTVLNNSGLIIESCSPRQLDPIFEWPGFMHERLMARGLYSGEKHTQNVTGRKLRPAENFAKI